METFWNGFEKRAGSLSIKRLRRIQGVVENSLDKDFRPLNRRLGSYLENKVEPVLLKEHFRNRKAGKSGTLFLGTGQDPYEKALERVKETRRKGGFKTLRVEHDS